MIHHLFRFALPAIALLLFWSCRDSDLKRMPDTLPDIKGQITTLSGSGEGTKDAAITILVKATEGTNAKVPAASIQVTNDTLIEDAKGKKLSVGALKQWQEVEVWFSGRIMESMPVQTDAIAIKITRQ